MWTSLYPIHQGLGHLLSALSLIAVVCAIVLAIKDIDEYRPTSIFFSIVVGLLDLQILLGLIGYAMIGLATVSTYHPVLAILAAIAFHSGKKMKRWKRVAGFLLGTVCIVGAVMLAVV